MGSSITRPVFASAAAYIAHSEKCWRADRREWPPANRDELVALQRQYPDRARQYIPAPRDLEAMGLPRTFGQKIKPFSDIFKERFFATLADREWRSAIETLMREGA